MVVGDFNLVRMAAHPHEADTPLIVDADIKLPLPVTGQLLEPISRRLLKILHILGGIEHFKLSLCTPLYVWRQFAAALSRKQPLEPDDCLLSHTIQTNGLLAYAYDAFNMTQSRRLN